MQLNLWSIEKKNRSIFCGNKLTWEKVILVAHICINEKALIGNHLAALGKNIDIYNTK